MHMDNFTLRYIILPYVMLLYYTIIYYTIATSLKLRLQNGVGIKCLCLNVGKS
jgi:hypothetical protein